MNNWAIYYIVVRYFKKKRKGVGFYWGEEGSWLDHPPTNANGMWSVNGEREREGDPLLGCSHMRCFRSFSFFSFLVFTFHYFLFNYPSSGFFLFLENFITLFVFTILPLYFDFSIKIMMFLFNHLFCFQIFYGGGVPKSSGK